MFSEDCVEGLKRQLSKLVDDVYSVVIKHQDGNETVFDNVVCMTFNDSILSVGTEDGTVNYYRIKHLISWHIRNPEEEEHVSWSDYIEKLKRQLSKDDVM